MRAKQCAYPTCHKLIPIGQRYCDEHKDTRNRPINRHKTYKQKTTEHVYNKNRYAGENARFTKFYKSHEWKAVRNYVIQRANGMCEQCLLEGRSVQGKIVDHKIPLRKAWDKRLDPNNLWYLCQYHHNKKTDWEQKQRKQDGGTNNDQA